MPSPFPGMDPYLEAPDIWPDLHDALASEIRGRLRQARQRARGLVTAIGPELRDRPPAPAIGEAKVPASPPATDGDDHA